MNIYFYLRTKFIGQVDFEKMKYIPRIGEEIRMDVQEKGEESRIELFDVVKVSTHVPNEIIVGKEPVIYESGITIIVNSRKEVKKKSPRKRKKGSND